jgi:hypothetical protein
MDGSSTETAAEANRLYWETDLPVGDIAARLDLSRRALYEAIRPTPAPGRCATCGSTLEYVKRSSRTHDLANCSACGQQTAPPAPREREGEPWTWSPPARAATLPEPEEPPQSIWALGAAALAGALLAAAATLAVVRRS